MADDSDLTFDSADAGASLTYPCEAGAVRKGSHVMLKGKPCKIVEISVSKTGKHGHAKCAFVGIDIFTNKKYEDMCPSTHNMDCPNVNRKEYQLLDLDQDNNNVSVLEENGNTKDDLNIPLDSNGNPEEWCAEMFKMFEDGDSILVTVLSSMGQEKLVACKKMQ